MRISAGRGFALRSVMAKFSLLTLAVLFLSFSAHATNLVCGEFISVDSIEGNLEDWFKAELPEYFADVYVQADHHGPNTPLRSLVTNGQGASLIFNGMANRYRASLSGPREFTWGNTPARAYASQRVVPPTGARLMAILVPGAGVLVTEDFDQISLCRTPHQANAPQALDLDRFFNHFPGKIEDLIAPLTLSHCEGLLDQ